jgi:hypothetical protein
LGVFHGDAWEPVEAAVAGVTSYGYCESLATFKSKWKMFKALGKMELPLPPAETLLPDVIEMWNKTKGGVDTMTAVIEHNHTNMGVTPVAKLLIRVMKVALLTGFRISQLFDVDPVNCKTLHEFREKRRKQNNFVLFTSRFVEQIRSGKVFNIQLRVNEGPEEAREGFRIAGDRSELTPTFKVKKRRASVDPNTSLARRKKGCIGPLAKVFVGDKDSRKICSRVDCDKKTSWQCTHCLQYYCADSTEELQVQTVSGLSAQSVLNSCFMKDHGDAMQEYYRGKNQ